MPKIKISAEELNKVQVLWEELNEDQLAVAQKILPLLSLGDIFDYDEVLKRGNPSLHALQRGEAIETSGTAEMLEYGPARFEGQKFAAFDEPKIVAAKFDRYLAFPTGHIASYSASHLEVLHVSGFVDFDNPCVEVTGDISGYTSILRLEADPVLLD